MAAKGLGISVKFFNRARLKIVIKLARPMFEEFLNKKALQAKKFMKTFVPLSEGNLEDSITKRKLTKKQGFGFRIFPNLAHPAITKGKKDTGILVGDYAKKMNEGNYKRGPKSKGHRQRQYIERTGKALSRIINKEAPEVLAKLIKRRTAG